MGYRTAQTMTFSPFEFNAQNNKPVAKFVGNSKSRIQPNILYDTASTPWLANTSYVSHTCKEKGRASFLISNKKVAYCIFTIIIIINYYYYLLLFIIIINLYTVCKHTIAITDANLRLLSNKVKRY